MVDKHPNFSNIEHRASVVETGAVPLEDRHERFSPRDLFADAVDDFVSRLFDRDISVVCDLVYSVPRTVFGDGHCVRQLLDCLLDNAGKLTHKGRIHVVCSFETNAPGPRLVFAVSDTGTGLSPEVRQQVLEAFYRADSSAKRLCDGLGLDLAAVRSLSRLMGADVDATCRATGESSFAVKTPVAHSLPPGVRKKTEVI